jgi:hypothetical protein
MCVNRARFNDGSEYEQGSDGDDSITSMDFEDDDDKGGEGAFPEKLDVHSIGDLFQMCKNECGSRKLSVLVYLILRFSGKTWHYIDDLLGRIGAYRCEAGVEENTRMLSMILSQSSKLKEELTLSILALENLPTLLPVTWQTSSMTGSTN